MPKVIMITMGQSSRSLFLEFSNFLLLFEDRHIFSLQSILNLLSKSFNPSIEQEEVIIPFFKQLSCIIHSWLFIKMIHNNDFSFFVFVIVELRQEFVSFDVRAWEIQGLSYVVLFVFIRLTEVNKQKIRFKTDWQLLCFDCDRCKVRDLTSCILFRLIPCINRLRFFFLIDKFPKRRRFDSPKELIFLFSCLFGT